MPIATNRTVADHLNDRQKLIVLLMKLTSATEDGHQDLAEVLRIRLCEKLVDHLSSGYFRVYGHLLSPRTWTTPGAYAQFESTTTTALAFNDRFATPGSVSHIRLKPALAELTFALETRFELEDQIFSRTRASSRARPGQIAAQPNRVAFAG